MRKPPTPKTGTGWGWLFCAAFVVYAFVLNGPNHKGERIRDEAVAGWNQGYSDTCAPYFAAEPGDQPSSLSPGCDSNGNLYNAGSSSAEVASS